MIMQIDEALDTVEVIFSLNTDFNRVKPCFSFLCLMLPPCGILRYHLTCILGVILTSYWLLCVLIQHKSKKGRFLITWPVLYHYHQWQKAHWRELCFKYTKLCINWNFKLPSWQGQKLLLFFSILKLEILGK